MKNIICISGTNRPDNFTLRSLKVVADELKKIGLSPMIIDACDLDLAFPGHPETKDAKEIQNSIKNAAGTVIATPEYHGTFSAMTKLILENLGFPSALSGKPVALVGVAQGRIGAVKSLEQLKGVCSHIGAIAVPGAVSIAGVQGIFDKDGNCTDDNAEKALRGAARSLEAFLKDYICPKYALEEMVRGTAESWSTNV